MMRRGVDRPNGLLRDPCERQVLGLGEGEEGESGDDHIGGLPHTRATMRKARKANRRSSAAGKKAKGANSQNKGSGESEFEQLAARRGAENGDGKVHDGDRGEGARRVSFSDDEIRPLGRDGHAQEELEGMEHRRESSEGEDRAETRSVGMRLRHAKQYRRRSACCRQAAARRDSEVGQSTSGGIGAEDIEAEGLLEGDCWLILDENVEEGESRTLDERAREAVREDGEEAVLGEDWEFLDENDLGVDIEQGEKVEKELLIIA